jgi:flagellar FliJ protein
MAQPKFHFSLEALLEHRQRIEKEQQRVVAKIQQDVQALVREIQQAEAKISAENKKLTTEKLVGHLDMQYISLEKRFVGNLHLKISMTMQQLMGVEKKLAAARVELLVAARSRKVIEKLKDKQLARWRAEQDRKESDLLDELGTQLTLRELQRLEAETNDLELFSHGEP